MCEVMQPTPTDTICEAAAGSGGFLCNAYQYVLDRFAKGLDADERSLREGLVGGMAQGRPYVRDEPLSARDRQRVRGGDPYGP